MKKLIKTISLSAILIASSAAFAAMEPAKKPLQFNPVSFSSANSSDVKQIANETRPASVLISVRSGSYLDTGVLRSYAGIIIQNCGQTKTVKSGSSVVCQLGSTPITFSSDSADTYAEGVYQIEYP